MYVHTRTIFPFTQAFIVSDTHPQLCRWVNGHEIHSMFDNIPVPYTVRYSMVLINPSGTEYKIRSAAEPKLETSMYRSKI